MKYRPDIDGLRTVAVMPVLVYHAGLGLGGGYVGVDVFFVISGFLITSIIWAEVRQGRFSILDFYERRARRIFPALFVMMFVATVLAVLLMIPSHLAAFGKSAFATTFFLSNVWFYLSTGYFTEAAELKPLLHTWSLGIEEQYYILFPPFLWLLFRLLGARGTIVVLSVCAMLSLGLSVVVLERNPAGAFYLPHTRAWELLVGSLLALFLAEGRGGARLGRPAVAVPLALFGLAAILWAVVSYGPETRFPGLAALPPCLGTAAIIAAGTATQTPVSRVLTTAPMVFMGKLSYSLYLWHWPVIVFVSYVSVDDLSPSLGLACLGLSFVLAYGSWRFVERPFRSRSRIGRPAIFAGAAAAMVAGSLMAGFLVVRDGLPRRMPAGFAELLDTEGLEHARRECHFVDAVRAAAGDLCHRGDIAYPPSFVWAGDSHADALSPAIFEAARAAGRSGYQYTNAGFRPLLGVEKVGFPGWGAQTDALVDFLDRHPGIGTVYVAAYWEHQLTGRSYRHAGDIWTDDGYDGSGSAYNPVATANGLARLAERLAPRRIVLLDDVPAGDALDLRTQVRLALFRQGDMAGRAGLPRTEAARQRALYEPLLASLAAQHENVEFRRVLHRLCGPEICPLFDDGGRPLFRDGDHLSADGARQLAPVLQEAFFADAEIDPRGRDMYSIVRLFD